MKMTVTITDSCAQIKLAEHFVGAVFSALFEQHMRLIGHPITDEGAELRAREIRDMRETLRSIPDKEERKRFVYTIGFLFKRERERRGWDIRGRDYAAKVRANGGGYWPA